MNRKNRNHTGFKSSLRSKIRSRPKIAAATGYLDLYLLNQEKSRLEQEMRTVAGKMKTIEASLQLLRKKISDTEKALLLLTDETGESRKKLWDSLYRAISLEY